MVKTDETKLSILLITPQLSFGGAEVHVVNLANGLIEKGHMVTVLSSGGALESQLAPEIACYCGPMHKKTLFHVANNALIIKRIIIERRINIIHTHAVMSTISGKITCLMGNKIPVVSTAHGWDKKSFLKVARLLDFSADKVIAVSRAVAKDLSKNGLCQEKIEVIYNGIDLGLFNNEMTDKEKTAVKSELGIDKDCLIVATVARLETPKGHAVLLRALPKVLDRYSKVRFLIVGDGSLRRELEKMAFDLGVRDGIIFSGWQADVKRILKVADVFCLPSLREGLPITIAEAMSVRMPVIASRVNGIPEMIIDGVTGYLVEPKDDGDLAKKLTILLSSQDLRYQMGEKGREQAEKLFSQTRMINQVENIYQLLAAKENSNSFLKRNKK